MAGARLDGGGAVTTRPSALPGSDTLTDGTGDDSVYGDPGDDVLYIGVGADQAYGEQGADTIYVLNDGMPDKIYCSVSSRTGDPGDSR